MYPPLHIPKLGGFDADRPRGSVRRPVSSLARLAACLATFRPGSQWWVAVNASPFVRPTPGEFQTAWPTGHLAAQPLRYSPAANRCAKVLVNWWRWSCTDLENRSPEAGWGLSGVRGP